MAAEPVPAADAGAIAALRPMLLQLARLQLRNDAWAEDVVSETVLAAVEALPRFDGKSRLATWVVGILKHKIVDQFRRSRREVSLEAEQEAHGTDALHEYFLADGHRASTPLDWGDPEAQASQGQFLAVLQACLERLPAPLARAFLLREWLELDTDQVCKEMQVTPTNCFVMLYRARLKLRTCLDVQWPGAAGRPSHG